MSLFEKIKIRLTEVKKEPPIESGSVDPANQQGTFRKNERNKKKIMRKLEPKGPKQGELNLGNTKTTNTPISTKRTLKGRPLGSKTKPKGETYKQLTTGSERQRQRKDIKKNFKTQQPISDLKKAKKYAKGEYPQIKIKGGENVSGGLKPQIKKPVKGSTPVKTNVSKVNVDKIFSGVGNVKTGGKVPDKNISPKSKGSTPVKTNVSRVNVDKIFDGPKNPIKKTIGVKQSDVSKQAKEFTAKINKRRAQRIKSATGGKKTGSLSKGNLSFPGDRSGAYQSTKSDIETKKLLKKAGASGDFSPTMPQDKREAGQKKRDARIKKYKTEDPFTSKTKGKTKFDDIFKGVKKQKIKSGGQTQFDISKTPTGKLELPSPKVSPDATRKRFDDLAKDISKFSKKARTTGSDIQDLKDVDKATMRTKPIKKVTVPDDLTRYDVGMAPRKITKKYAPGTTGKVQMRPSATNIPSGSKTPPKTYNIPPDDSPGKLVQGRDFPSKKTYDAKLEKQVKILRGKVDNLRKKQIQIAKTNPAKETPEYKARSVSVKKIGARMKERTKTADALQRSLKRQGTIGPTSMLPVVSGKGADKLMPGMGEKSKMTYKQFYKAANVGKQYKPPKIKPKPKVTSGTSSSQSYTPPNQSYDPQVARQAQTLGRYKKYKSYMKGRGAGRILKTGFKKLPKSGKAAVIAAPIIAGAAIYNALKKKPLNPYSTKDFKRNEIKTAGGLSLTDIKEPTPLDKELMNSTSRKFSKAAIDQMGKGGRYDTPSGNYLSNYIKTNKDYRKQVEKTVKDRGYKKQFNPSTGKFKNYSGDPYGILNKKS